MFPLGSRQATLSHSPAGGLSSSSGISVGLRRLRSLPRITRAVLRSWPSHGVLGLPDERSGRRPVLWVSPTFPALRLQSFCTVPRPKGGRRPRSRRVSSAIRPCMDVNKALCLGTPRNLRPLYFFPRRHYVGGLRAHALREAVGEGRPVFPNLARAAHANRATHRPAGVSCVRSRSLTVGRGDSAPPFAWPLYELSPRQLPSRPQKRASTSFRGQLRQRSRLWRASPMLRLTLG